MKKRWIVLGAVLAILIAAVAVAALNVDAWLDENRPMIEEEASAAVGRAVHIDDLGVTLWGGFGVGIGGHRIGEDPSYGEGHFLTLDRGIVRVSIWPAIFGRIEIAEVVLEAPEIRVIRDERGMSIDSLMAADAPEAEPEETESSLDLTVSSLRIVQGRIVFEDRTGDETVESIIDHVDLAVQDVSADRPLHFVLSASLLGAAEPNLEAEGTAGPVLAPTGTPLAFNVTFRLDALSLDDVARMEDVAASLPEGARIGGTLDATLEAAGVPDDIAFDFALDAANADLVLGADLVKPPGVALGLTAKGAASGDVVDVSTFAFTLAGARLEGRAKAGLDERGAYDATIQGEGVPLAGWGDLLPALAGLPVEGRLALDLKARGDSISEALPRLAGTMSLTGVAVRLADTPPVEKLEAHLTFDDARAELRKTHFEVGGAPMQLEADVDDLNAPQVRFALDAPLLPLSALGVLEPGTEASNQLRDLRVVGRADLRGEVLAADARFASPAGRLQGVIYTAMAGRASLVGERMKLEEMTLDTLGGEVAISGSLDATEPENPLYDCEIDLAGVQIAQLVDAFFPTAGKIASGRIDTKLSIDASGLDTDALLESLTASGRMGVRDGVVYDVNLAEEALSGITGVPGLSSLLSPELRRSYPQLFETGDTRFRSVRTGIEVFDGRVHTKDLVLEAQDFGLEGGGTVGLDGRVDLKTIFMTSAALGTSLVGVASPTRYLLDRSGRLAVPVNIEGQIAAPKVRPDNKFVADAVARAAVGTVSSVVGGLLGGGESKTNGEQGTTGDPAKSTEPPNGSEPSGGLESDLQRGIEGIFGK